MTKEKGGSTLLFPERGKQDAATEIERGWFSEKQRGGGLCLFFLPQQTQSKDGRSEKTATTTKKRGEDGFSLCFFFIAPLNAEQHPQRQPVRSQASELASQWGAGT